MSIRPVLLQLLLVMLQSSLTLLLLLLLSKRLGYLNCMEILGRAGAMT